MAKTITINISEETDEKFRRVASRVYGKRKGYLGKAVSEALGEWAKEKEADDAVAAARKLLKKGIKTERKWKFNRDEIYAERLLK